MGGDRGLGVSCGGAAVCSSSLRGCQRGKGEWSWEWNARGQGIRDLRAGAGSRTSGGLRGNMTSAESCGYQGPWLLRTGDVHHLPPQGKMFQGEQQDFKNRFRVEDIKCN